MKLNKIASALGVACLVLSSSAAWADTVNAADAAPGVTATTTLNGTVVPLGTAGATTTVTGSATLVDTLGGNGSVSGLDTTLGAGAPDANGNPSAAKQAWGSGILGTPHDFASGTGSPTGSASVGLCTFCHTPHKAGTTLLLWNHTMSSNTFAWDVAATTAGTALPGFVGNTYKGPSAKCLSCHDGSIAVGDIGWFNQTVRKGAANVNGFKVGAGSNGDSMLVGAGGDLSGTHPVAIPYPLNGAPNVYNGSTTGARLATNDFVTDPTANNMRLYSDVGGGQIVGKIQPGKTGIECSTCHDPHNKASRGDFFLRGSLVGSTQASGYICLQCHVK
jgi:hypothetical protein